MPEEADGSVGFDDVSRGGGSSAPSPVSEK